MWTQFTFARGLMYGSSFSFEDRRVVQDFIFLCQRESILENLLNKQKDQMAFKFIPNGTYFKKHGLDAAQELRDKLNYKSNKISEDIYKDFRRLGIHIFRKRLDNENISGLYINDAVAGHCVLVNYNEDVYRQRFSVAHEVAHAIFDSEEDYILSLKNDQDLRETRANEFASAYLVPSDIIKNLPKISSANAQEYSNKLLISTHALAIALRKAKLITKQELEEIKSVKVESESKIDPEMPLSLSIKQRERRQYMLEQGLSLYYVDLCFEAYDKDLISCGYLIESLGIEYSELSEVCEMYGRTIKRDF